MLGDLLIREIACGDAAAAASHEQIRNAEKARGQKLNTEAYIEKLRLLLHAYGFEQSPTESFCETVARALGIATRDLRTRLQDGSFNGTLRKWAACGPQ
jgi:hypothetical protein